MNVKIVYLIELRIVFLVQVSSSELTLSVCLSVCLGSGHCSNPILSALAHGSPSVYIGRYTQAGSNVTVLPSGA